LPHSGTSPGCRKPGLHLADHPIIRKPGQVLHDEPAAPTASPLAEFAEAGFAAPVTARLETHWPMKP